MVYRTKKLMRHISQEDYVSSDFPDYTCENPLILACHNNDYAAIELLMPPGTDNGSSRSNAVADQGVSQRGDAKHKGGGTNLLLAKFSPKTT